MRIVFTVPSLGREFGGPVEKALGLRAALIEKGHQVRLIGAASKDDHGLATVGTLHGTPIPREFGPLRRAVQQSDVVHILGYRDPVGTVAASAAVRAGVPYVLEPCGMHRPRLRSVALKRVFDGTIGRRIVARATTLIATSELERRELVEDGVAEAVIRTRMNGLTLSAGHLPPRGAVRRRFGIPSDAPFVLALGRITRAKGHIYLVHAVLSLDHVHLLIAGPNADDGALDAVKRAAPWRDARIHVYTMGLWGREKLAGLADADCFAMPSLTENFGNAAAEAAAVGLPVVVSDACGVAEALDRHAHQVVAPGHVQDLAVAISSLVTPGARAKAMAAAKSLRSLLDWRRLATEQVRIYESVLRS